jgi:hypothetical protein
MKKLLILLVLINSVLFAQTIKKQVDKELEEKALKAQMEKEKKYAKEQQFYQADDYDFKSMEVDPKSLKHLPEIEEENLDMDDVYN